jgi:hypothetical protein
MCEEAVVVNVTLQQNPPNTTYGQIQAGSLTIEGQTLVIKWRYNEQRTQLAEKICVDVGFDVRKEGWTKKEMRPWLS